VIVVVRWSLVAVIVLVVAVPVVMIMVMIRLTGGCVRHGYAGGRGVVGVVMVVVVMIVVMIMLSRGRGCGLAHCRLLSPARWRAGIAQ
jgi:hypothetical protein